MKKIAMVSGLFLTVIFLSSAVFAQTPGTTDNSKKTTSTQTISGTKGCVHKDCAGKCDPTNKGKNKDCPNFVDKNKDGVCDNYSAGKPCCGKDEMKGKGKCCGKGEMKGKGCCCGKEAAKPVGEGKSK